MAEIEDFLTAKLAKLKAETEALRVENEALYIRTIALILLNRQAFTFNELVAQVHSLTKKELKHLSRVEKLQRELDKPIPEGEDR